MTVTVLERVDWGADGGSTPTSGYPIPHAQVVGLAVHHTVMDYRGDPAGYMRVLQHARPDLGDEVPYSFVVFPGSTPDDAVVAHGRGFGRSGAHTIGYNSTRYGCAYAGNASVDTITPGVLDGFRWVGQHLHDPVNAAATFGHRDVKSTECPGNNLYPLLDRLQPPFTAPAPAPPPDLRRNEEPMIVKLANPRDKHPPLLIAGPRAVVVPGALVDDYERAGVPVVELHGPDAVGHYDALADKLRP